MAKAGKKTYYWDTCCFIAWLTGEGHPKEVLDGLDEIAREVTENRAMLCTSVMTNTEILDGQLTAEQSEKFQNIFKRRNVTQITLDQRISRKASEIRNYYNQKGIKVKTPDATHLASAIIYQADEFHTLDGSGERKRPSSLLSLNGDVAGSPLHIRVPTAVQGKLSFSEAPAQKIAKSGEHHVEAETIESSAASVSGSGNGPIASEAAARGENKTETEAKEEIKEGPPSL